MDKVLIAKDILQGRARERATAIISDASSILCEDGAAKEKLLQYALQDRILEAKVMDVIRGENIYLENIDDIRDILLKIGRRWAQKPIYKYEKFEDLRKGIKLYQVNEDTFNFQSYSFMVQFRVIPDKTVNLEKSINVDKLTEKMKVGHDAYEYLETMAFLNAIREIIVEDLTTGDKEKKDYDGKLFIKLINAWKKNPAMEYGGQIGYNRRGGGDNCLHLQQLDSTKFALWNDKIRAVFVTNGITPDEIHKAEKEGYGLYYTEKGKEWFKKSDETKEKKHARHGHLVLMVSPSGKKRWMNPDKAKKKGYKPAGNVQPAKDSKPETKERRMSGGVFGKNYGEIVSFKYKGSKDERQRRRMGVYLGDAVTKHGKKVRHFIDLSLDKNIPDEESEPGKFKQLLNKIKKLPKIIKIKRYLNKYKKKYENSNVSPETVYRLISKGLMNKYPDLKYRTFKPRKMRKSEDLYIYINGEMVEDLRKSMN